MISATSHATPFLEYQFLAETIQKLLHQGTKPSQIGLLIHRPNYNPTFLLKLLGCHGLKEGSSFITLSTRFQPSLPPYLFIPQAHSDVFTDTTGFWATLEKSDSEILITLSRKDSMGQDKFPSPLLTRLKIQIAHCEEEKRPQKLKGATLSDGKLLETFRKEMREKVFSASELEAFQKCPFRYFVEYLLGVRPPEELLPEGSPLEIGQFTHRILEELFKHKSQDLKKIFEEYEDQFLKKTPHINPHLWGRRRQTLLKVLKQVMEKERAEAQDKGGLVPTHFEWSFIHENLKGRVDRIDVTPEQDRFRILDYKTGSRKVTKKSVLEGEALQLPLYLYAVREKLYPRARALGATYYYLTDLTETHITEEEWEGLVAQALQRVADIKNRIATGIFPHGEDCEKSCLYRSL